MKMKEKIVPLLVAAINVIGAICLIRFAVPYLTHSTAVRYPGAMLPAEAWDRAGMALTFGFLPLLLANILGFVFIKARRKPVRLLFFIPSAVCFLIVVSYWITAFA